ncbi:TGS domain-containing protein, partial [Candidatus Marsarchaeota archaeon]|nr:TGS domain-containing protein [Candidatus Marsarchaeota archaeon]
KGVLTGLKVSGEQIADAIGRSHLTSSNIGWSAADIEKFASELLHIAKPFIIASNKTDAAKDKAKTGALEAKFGADRIVRTSAEMELALRKASKAGLASYVPGARDFSISESASGEQRKALEYMRSYVSHGGTGVQELIDKVVFGLLDNVVAYPVEDENKYSDHFGNVLPDAYLMKKGSTALDLAGRIHTDIAKSMLYAIDAKRKMRLAKDYELKGNDVIKIVSAAR